MSANPAPALAYRPDIDGLRAFAVLSVVAYHAFPAILQSGFIGVDVFFVISGYLISGIILNDLQQGTFTLRNFYSRRIRRIFPALLLVLAAVLIFGWFALFPSEYRSLGNHVAGGAAFISNFLLWREAGYFDAVAKTKPLLHLWSLGIEEQFYIFFPLLLWVCAKNHFRSARLVIFLCAASFLVNMYCMQDSATIFYSPYTRIWELLAGAAFRMAMRQPSAPRRYLRLDALANTIMCCTKRENDGRCLSLALALFGVIFFGLALLLVREADAYPGWKALLPVAGTPSLLAAGPANPVSKYFLANRLAVFVGLVSYPFYLWHWVLIACAYIIIGGLDPGTGLLRIGLVAASFVLAVLTYFGVEQPIRFGAWARTEKIYALIIGMIVVGMAGLSVYLMEGLPGRQSIKEFAAVAKQMERAGARDEAGLSYTGITKDMLGYYSYTGVGADETVAVIGDSHAHAAYWGIAKLGRELRYNTVLLGWIIPAGEMWDTERAALIPVVLEILKKKNDIRKIFFCTRGGYLPRIGYEPFKESLQSYVDILREYGKEIFIVSEVPTLPDDLRDYIGRPFRPAKKSTFPEVRKADVIKSQEKHIQLLSEIRHATVINTIGPMCPGGTCLVFTEDGLPMYLDDNHLTSVGSEFLAERILKPYLPGKKGE